MSYTPLGPVTGGAALARARGSSLRLLSLSWTAATGVHAGFYARGICDGPGGMVATGSTAPYVITSSDGGKTWTDSSAAENNNWRSVTYGNGRYVAVSSTGTNRSMWSATGAAGTWTATNPPAVRTWRKVVYFPAAALFVAVSIDSLNQNIATSPDGVTWTMRVQAGANVSKWSGLGVGFDGAGVPILLAVGEALGGAAINKSYDGVAWTAVASPADAFTVGLTGISYSPELKVWAAVGENSSDLNCMVSTDGGATWTTTSGVYDFFYAAVANAGCVFAAVAADGPPNRASTSADGIVWDISSNSNVVPPSVVWQDVCARADGSGFVAVGQNANIMWADLQDHVAASPAMDTRSNALTGTAPIDTTSFNFYTCSITATPIREGRLYAFRAHQIWSLNAAETLTLNMQIVSNLATLTPTLAHYSVTVYDTAAGTLYTAKQAANFTDTVAVTGITTAVVVIEGVVIAPQDCLLSPVFVLSGGTASRLLSSVFASSRIS